MEKEEVKKLLSEVVEKLISKYKPLSIILYGSYAYGNPTEDSDIDLLILKKTNKRRVDRFIQVKKIIYNPNNKIPISPLIYNLKELEERLRIGDDFIKEIYKKGTILYEKASS
jgi:predicted nucleotidyltransferase